MPFETQPANTNLCRGSRPNGSSGGGGGGGGGEGGDFLRISASFRRDEQGPLQLYISF